MKKIFFIIIIFFCSISCREIEEALNILNAPKFEITKSEIINQTYGSPIMKIWVKNNSGADCKAIMINADLKQGSTIKGQVKFYWTDDYDFFAPNEEIILGDSNFDTGGLISNLTAQEAQSCTTTFIVINYMIWENGQWVLYK